MTTAITAAAERGAKVVVCASTGNTSASAAAYATAAGHDLRGAGAGGQDRDGQAEPGDRARRALLQVDGNFDDCLVAGPQARRGLPGRAGQLGEPGPHRGPEDRGLRGRRRLGDAPDIHCCRSATPATSPRTGRATPSTPADGPATRDPRDVGLPGGRCGADRRSATRSTSRTPSPPRSGSATPPPGSRPSAARDDVRRASSRPSPTSRSSPRTAAVRARWRLRRARLGRRRRRPPGARTSRAGARRAARSSSRSRATASRTRSGRCAPRTAARWSPSRVRVDVVSIADALELSEVSRLARPAGPGSHR